MRMRVASLGSVQSRLDAVCQGLHRRGRLSELDSDGHRVEVSRRRYTRRNVLSDRHAYNVVADSTPSLPAISTMSLSVTFHRAFAMPICMFSTSWTTYAERRKGAPRIVGAVS